MTAQYAHWVTEDNDRREGPLCATDFERIRADQHRLLDPWYGSWPAVTATIDAGLGEPLADYYDEDEAVRCCECDTLIQAPMMAAR